MKGSFRQVMAASLLICSAAVATAQAGSGIKDSSFQR